MPKSNNPLKFKKEVQSKLQLTFRILINKSYAKKGFTAGPPYVISSHQAWACAPILKKRAPTCGTRAISEGPKGPSSL